MLHQKNPSLAWKFSTETRERSHIAEIISRSNPYYNPQFIMEITDKRIDARGVLVKVFGKPLPKFLDGYPTEQEILCHWWWLDEEVQVRNRKDKPDVVVNMIVKNLMDHWTLISPNKVQRHRDFVRKQILGIITRAKKVKANTVRFNNRSKNVTKAEFQFKLDKWISEQRLLFSGVVNIEEKVHTDDLSIGVDSVTVNDDEESMSTKVN